MRAEDVGCADQALIDGLLLQLAVSRRRLDESSDFIPADMPPCLTCRDAPQVPDFRPRLWGGEPLKEGRMKIFGREPALWLSLIQTVVALAVGLGLSLTGEQVGLVNGAAAAVLALVAAFAVKPFPVPLLMGAMQSVLALAVGFGLELAPGQVGLVNAAAAALVGFIMRMHVEPSALESGLHTDRDVSKM